MHFGHVIHIVLTKCSAVQEGNKRPPPRQAWSTINHGDCQDNRYQQKNEMDNQGQYYSQRTWSGSHNPQQRSSFPNANLFGGPHQRGIFCLAVRAVNLMPTRR